MDKQTMIIQVLDKIVKEASLQEIMNEASRAVEKPMWIADTNDCFLTDPAAVFSMPDMVKEIWKNGGAMPKESMAYIHKNQYKIKMEKLERPLKYHSQDIDRDIAVMPIRVEGITLAYYTVCEREESPITEEDMEKQEEIGKLLALALPSMMQLIHEASSESAIFLQLLVSGGENAAHVRERLEVLKYRWKKKLRLGAVYKDPGETRRVAWYFAAEKEVRRIFPGCLTAEYYGHLFFLINYDEEISSKQLEQFSALMQGGTLKGAIGYAFTPGDLEQMNRIYQDLMDFLCVNESLTDGHRFFFYDQSVPELSAFYQKGKMDPLNIAGGALRKLREFDSTGSWSSEKTLEVLLRYHFDAEKAAADLQLHKNTVRYRMNVIRELTGLDFQDSRVIFELVLAVNLLKLKA